MRYFVVEQSDSNNPVAILFHDYLTKHYIIRSKSEAFRRSFEAAVSSVGSINLQKVGKKLKIFDKNIDNPSWSRNVLKKACGTYWIVAESGDIACDAFVDEVIARFLK